MRTLIAKSFSAMAATAALVLGPAIAGSGAAFAAGDDGGEFPKPIFYDSCDGPAQLVIPAEGSFMVDGAPAEAGIREVASEVTVNVQEGDRTWTFTNDNVACPTRANVQNIPMDSVAASIFSGTVYDFSFEATPHVGGPDNGYARNAFDGNPASFWHSPWSGQGGASARARRMPHWVTADLGEVKQVEFVEYTRRAAANGQARFFTVLTSQNGEEFEVVAFGELANLASAPHKATIPIGVQQARYVAFYVHNAINGISYVNAGEIRFGNNLPAESDALKEPTFIDLGSVNRVHIPYVRGVQYRIAGEVKEPGYHDVDGQVTVTAEATQNFFLPDHAQKEWQSGEFPNTADCTVGQINNPVGDKLSLNAQVAGFDTESVNGRGGEQRGNASNAVDGDPATLWHTPWDNTGGVLQVERRMPHHLEIDLGADHEPIGALKYFHRGKPAGSDGFAGSIRNVEVLSSNDGLNFTSRGCYTLPSLIDTPAPATATINLTEDLTDRYVALYITGAYRNTGFVSINELEFYKRNLPPTIGLESFSARAGETLNQDLVIADPEQTTVTVSVEGLPVGLRVEERNIVGEVTEAMVGSHTLTIRAVDAANLETSKEIQFTIAANSAPVLSVSQESVSVLEGRQVSVDVTAEDSDGDAVRVSLESGHPNWVMISENTIVIAPTEVPSQLPVVVTLKADDGHGGQATKQLSIMVSANQLPQINAEDFQVRAGSVIDNLFTAVDPEGTEVSVSISGQPDWLIAEAGRVSGQAPDVGGVFQFTVSAQDADGKIATQEVELTVIANQAPTISLAPDSMEAYQGQNVESVIATADDVRVVSTVLETGSPAWLRIEGGKIVGTIDTDQAPGDVTVTVKVTDDEGLHSSALFTLKVKENHAPSIVASEASVLAGEEINIPAVVTDADQHAVHVEISGVPGLTWLNNAIIGPAPDEARTYTLRITARDALQKETVKEIQLTVMPRPAPNSAPRVVLEPGFIIAFQGQTVTSTVKVTDAEGNANDPTVADEGNWASIVGETVTVRIPEHGAGGEHPVTISVSDSGNLRGEATLMVIVRTHNAPSVQAEDASVQRGSQIDIPVLTSDDVSDTVSVTLVQPPAGLTLNDQNHIVGIAPTDGPDQLEVVIRATDGHGKSATYTVTITLTEIPPPPPPAENKPPKVRFERPFLELPQGATFVAFFEAEDEDGNIVDREKKGPSWATLQFDRISGRIPLGHELGEVTVTVAVTDDSGAKGTAELTIRVIQNHPPVISAPAEVTVQPNGEINIPVSATDGNGHVVTFAVKGIDEINMRRDAIVGVAPAVPGRYELTLTATDYVGEAVEQKIVLNVVSPNQSPSVSLSPAIVEAFQGQDIESVITSNDDGEIVSTVLEAGAPAWLRIVEGKLVGTVDKDQGAGDVTATVRVTDDKGAQSLALFTVKVKENRAPVITAQSASVRVGGVVRIPISASDSDGHTVRIVVSGANGFTFADGAINGTAPVEAGELELTITATDELGKATAKRIALTVTPNEAPVVALTPPRVEVFQGEPFTVAIEARDGDGNIVDGPKKDVGAPRWANIVNSQLIGVAPQTQSPGEVKIPIVATDNDGSVGRAELTVLVKKNHAPVVEATDVSVQHGEAINIPVRVTDADRHTFTVVLVGETHGLKLNAAGTSITGRAPTTGSKIEISILATDQFNMLTHKKVTVDLTPAVAPTATASPQPSAPVVTPTVTPQPSAPVVTPTVTPQPSTPVVTPPAGVERFAGADRVATSLAAWKGGSFSSKTVILANAFSFADAVAAGPLAGALDAPVVLSAGKVLEADTLAALKSAGINKVVLAGGENVLSEKLAGSLRAAGIEVERVAGRNRFATAVALAGATAKAAEVEAVMVADGMNFADGLTAGAVAKPAKAVVIYSNSKVLPAESRIYLSMHAKNKVYGVGGKAASALNSSGWTNGVRSTAIVGTDRYATAVELAKTFAPQARDFVVATGANFSDALAAAGVAANRGGALLLTPQGTLPVSVESYLRKVNARSVAIVGGPNSVSTNVEKTLKALVR
ncbi:MAG: putative Ig domain-containing protein [Buchananella hordeovulneris]|nr:putative Ig domain-containing protein [Buchananella hordeovulneris]